MQTAFTYKLLLEREDRARFGFKPHSECCTLIVVYRLRMEHLVFDPETLIAFYIPVFSYPMAGVGLEVPQGLLTACAVR